MSRQPAQYADDRNLSARQRIYTYAAPARPWFDWVFDRLDLPPDARVLELGCGNGMLWKSIAPRVPDGWNLTLTDLSEGMLAQARRNLAAVGRPCAFARVDATALPFEAHAFDAVIANHVLYHVPDRPRALGEIRRVLRPGGGRLYAATNGSNHQRTTRELMARHLHPSAGDIFDGVSEVFGLDNGEAQLRPFFADVRLHRNPGELAVTDAQTVVDYVLSFDQAKGVLTGETLRRLREEVGRAIAADGAFRIPTDTGLFIATATATATATAAALTPSASG